MSTNNATFTLTKDAVRTVVNPTHGVQHQEFIVVVSMDLENATSSGEFRNCIISDDTFKTPAYILHPSVLPSTTGFSANSAAIIRVFAYVTSHANYNRKGLIGAATPFLCITSFKTLKIEPSCSIGRSLTDVPQPKKTRGGRAGTEFQRILPQFSNEELASCFCANTLGVSESGPMKNIALFLANHHAMKMLSIIEQCSNYDQNNDNTSNNVSEKYCQSINEFKENQMLLQITSLTKNAGKHNSDGATNLVKRYSSTLQVALVHAREPTHPPLSIELLCSWHKELGSDLIPNAGIIREKNVKAGCTLFGHKDGLKEELKKLIDALREFERRVMSGGDDSSRNSENVNTGHALGLVVFAAAALYGVNDLHPWEDGNGRMSRIVSNWALARAGLPFVVNFFANASQRTEYINAIETTRRNLHLVCIGNVSKDIFSMVQRFAGTLKPMIDLVFDRIDKAVLECRNLISEKSRLVSEEEDAKVAKRFRDAAASGTCLICYDDGPNIATLCCGKAVHLSCMATWLSSKLECPHCRSAFPSMPQRPSRSLPFQPIVLGGDPRDAADIPETTAFDATYDEFVEETQTTEEVTETTMHDYDDTETFPLQNDDDSPQVDETETTTYEEGDTATTTVEDNDDTPHAEQCHTTTFEEEDTTTTTTVFNDEAAPQVEETETTTIEEQDTTTTSNDGHDGAGDFNVQLEDTTETTTATYYAQQEPNSLPHRCNFCNNIAARECDNQSCGACCQLYGPFSCSRHYAY